MKRNGSTMMTLRFILFITYGITVVSGHEAIYRTLFTTPTPWMMVAKYGNQCDPPGYSSLDHPDCKGGVPGLGAWIAHWRNDSSLSGIVVVGSIDDGSTFSQLHPRSKTISVDIWKLLDTDFSLLRGSGLEKEESTSNLTDTAASYGIPILSSGLVLEARGMFYLLNRVVRYYYKEMPNGVRIGYITLQGDRYFREQLPYSYIFPRLTEILRDLNCLFIVVLCGANYLRFSAEGLVELRSYDIDVIVQPVETSLEASVTNIEGKFVVTFSGWQSYIYRIDLIVETDNSKLRSVVVQTVNVGGGELPDNYNVAYHNSLKSWLSKEQQLALKHDPFITKSKTVSPSRKDRLSDAKTMETQTGNLVSECMRFTSKSDVAFLNGGALGRGWRQGEVHASDVLRLFKHADHLVSYNVTGRSLWTTLEFGLSHLTSSGQLNETSNNPGSFAQVAGVRFTYNPELPPLNRITSLWIADRNTENLKEAKFYPVRRGRIYTITTVSFIALGDGDGYLPLYRSPIPGTFINSIDTMLSTALINYLRDRNPYESFLDGRIQVNQDSSLNLNYLFRENCTATQYYVEDELDCYDCPPGFVGSFDTCTLVQPSSSTSKKVILITIGAVIVGLGLPVGIIFMRKHTKMRGLYNTNKLAEECAAAVAAMRFEEVNYLYDLQKPTVLQKAFLDIIHNLKLYRPFLPASLFPLEAGGSVSDGYITDAPGGDIAIVFTDIQGSTDAWERLPDAMRDALSIHNRVLRQLITNNNGYEVKTIGDAFMIVFASLENAITFAGEAQRELMDSSRSWPPCLSSLFQCDHVPGLWYGLRIRVGVHVGEAVGEVSSVTGRTDYFGPTINKAARIERVCPGGAIALSEDVIDRLEDTRSRVLSAFEVVSKSTSNLNGIDEACVVTVVVPAELAGRCRYFIEVQNPLIGFRLGSNLSAVTSVYNSGSSVNSETLSTSGKNRRLLALPGLDFAKIDHCTVATVNCVYESGALATNVQQSLSVICTCSDRTNGAIAYICDNTIVLAWNTYQSNEQHILSSIRFVGLLNVATEKQDLRDVRVGVCIGDASRGNVGTVDRRFLMIVGAVVEASRQLVAYARELQTFSVISMLPKQPNPFDDVIMRTICRLIGNMKFRLYPSLKTPSSRTREGDADLRLPVYELRASSIDSKLRHEGSDPWKLENSADRSTVVESCDGL